VWKWQVEKGDTYTSISERTGVSIADLRKWNPNVKENCIQINSILNISDPTAQTQPVLPSITFDSGETIYINYPTLYETYIIGVFIDIELDAPGSDGDYQWFQSFTTNCQTGECATQSLHPIATFLDSSPDESNYPFYPKKEVNGQINSFKDWPARQPTEEGRVYMTLELSLMKKVDGGYIRMATFTYGFMIYSSGNSKSQPFTYTDSPSQEHIELLNSLVPQPQ
jgi:LysM repeat protein